MFDIFREQDKDKKDTTILIFMALADQGDLLTIMEKDTKPIETNRARKWVAGIVDALDFMHTVHHIAHRDMKCENVLVDKYDNALLTDFGFSKAIKMDNEGKPELSDTWCGSKP